MKLEKPRSGQKDFLSASDLDEYFKEYKKGVRE